MTGLPTAARALLLDPATRGDTALYQRLHAEAPVLRTAGMWLVSGHAPVSRLAGDPRLTIDPRAGDPPLPLTQSERLDRVFGDMLSFRDGAAHRRLRGLVAGAFSARRTAALAGLVADVVRDLLDEAGPAFDVVADLADPLPVRTSCALLGLPPGAWPRVERWARALTGQLFRFGQPADVVADAERQLDELLAYVDSLPAGGLLGDLRGAPLSRDERAAFAVLLLVNGVETVTAAVGGCVAALLWRPGVAELVRDQPRRAEEVVDECLRLDGPVWLAARRAAAPIALDGHRIATDDPVFLLWAVANRDPAVFPDPDAFRPGRPPRHLAFGKGPHHCLGAALARVQAAEVLRQLARRRPHADPAAARRRHTTALTGYASLPVETSSRRWEGPPVPRKALTGGPSFGMGGE